MRFSIFPRDEKFFFLIHQSASNIQKIAGKLQDLLNDYENVPAKVAEIKVLEEFGDSVIHNVMNALHRTFVTPIDREDLAALAERLDDVVDAIEESTRLMVEYHVKQPTSYAIELAHIILQCGNALEPCIGHLQFQGTQLKEIMTIKDELNLLEDQADQVTSRAIGELFDTQDAIAIIKWKDIYNQLEGATDRFEDIASILESIVIKNA